MSLLNMAITAAATNESDADPAGGGDNLGRDERLACFRSLPARLTASTQRVDGRQIATLADKREDGPDKVSVGRSSCTVDLGASRAIAHWHVHRHDHRHAHWHGHAVPDHPRCAASGVCHEYRVAAGDVEVQCPG